ncbi:Hypothetical predicted protein, partial [Pelobates cultripes]
MGDPGPLPRGPLAHPASHHGGDIELAEVRNTLVMADAMCAKAPSHDTADILSKLDLIFARFWSML